MSRKEFQEVLDKTIQIEADLKEIQTQIEDIQSYYLEKTWTQGNILIGWNTNINASQYNPSLKIKLAPKDKSFSLSSVSSNVHKKLQQNADKGINVSQQFRFVNSKKKYKKLKKKLSMSTIRKKIRRRY